MSFFELSHRLTRNVSFLTRLVATLYDGPKSCPQERHVHVLCDTGYIAHLIGWAEPELAEGYAILVCCCGSC